MSAPVFLFTPPFTQLNTPYPATAYLKGFLNTLQQPSFQADLGIEVTLSIFSKKGLTDLFSDVQPATGWSENAQRIFSLRDAYCETIDSVILFLQGKNPTLAYQLVKRGFLPEASRFSQVKELEWAFGSMGRQDHAKHLATMYLEDLADFISECVDPHFGFSRYAEKLGRSASSFDALHAALQAPLTYTDQLLLNCLQQHIETQRPSLVAVSVPFPGNLYAAFRCAQWIKNLHPSTKTVMGGGYANTELRSLSDARVFAYFDFITLDDGEMPLERLLRYLDGQINKEDLQRTYLLQDGIVEYIYHSNLKDYPQAALGTPDYSDLLLDQYISAIETVNPMHSLWSDGRWNKLTMAHGCYWGKCTFCDISLDYIKQYEPLTAPLLCDRMETIMKQTGQNGFHFVDEAAPPALMRALAIEILKRRMVVSWWTNIRFEKSFTRDLCLLLKAAGCIAVSGGLEVASDRLLALIQKGITVAQVANVNRHFTDAGIMVHAYLMYGFPTQTSQETIDALEMVRQMFKTGILQSAFWHQFTMTAHSPVGLEPSRFGVKNLTVHTGSFANNDLEHEDPAGTDHAAFAFGLKKSLHNYMHGANLDDPLHKWFDFKIPRTRVAPDYISNALQQPVAPSFRATAKVIWIGHTATIEHHVQTKHGNSREMATLTFTGKTETQKIQLPAPQGDCLFNLLQQLSVHRQKTFTMEAVKAGYEAAGLEDFELFWDNKPVNTLYKSGLLVV